MTRTVWVVMAAIILVLGITTAIVKAPKKSKPGQEIARAVLVPTEQERRVIIPPCGTGVPVASRSPGSLAKTPGSVVFFLQKGRGDRLVVVPRCKAAQGAQPSEGANLPAAAFILPIGAQITAGRAGSAEAGTEKVQAQIVIPANSPIKDVVVTGCIQPKKEAEKTATGRAFIMNPEPGRQTEALAPPC